ncbi:TPA: NAD(P)/FAD-dependent oxidoreductase [Providencia stuartii]
MGRIPSDSLTQINCDVVVVGGGVAGTVAARTLSLLGIRVVLLDSSSGVRQKVGESLPAAARPMLHKLGLLNYFNDQIFLTNYGNLSCWGSKELRETDFIRDPYGCGYHLDRRLFEQALLYAAEDLGTVLIKEHVSSFIEMDDGIKVQAGKLNISAKWMINASGNSQFIAKKLSVSRQKDPLLFALYTWFDSDILDTRSVIEAVSSGWWYTAGLPNGKRILVFFTLPNQAKAILREENAFSLALKETMYIHQYCPLESVTRNQLEMIEATGGYSEKVFGHNWIAVGDAALSFDPISSQGIYNAIYTGLRGAEAIKAVLTDNDHKLLTKYGLRIKSIRYAYSNEVSRYYQQETRWRNKEFWQVQQVARI